MARTQKSENVPKGMQDKFDQITALTDKFAAQHLNGEYAQLIRYVTAALCRKRPSPLEKGQAKTWACGITHAVGMVNFLFDSSQKPHISASDLYQEFGVSGSTGQSKSKQVRDVLKMGQFDPNWCLPSKLEDNPLVWMISFNGMIIDVRSAPRPIQEVALAKGLIPYIPGERPGDEEPEDEEFADEAGELGGDRPAPAAGLTPDALYTLTVYLLDGPLTEAFVEKNPVVSRTIEIKGSNTLEDLHRAIFKAFDREEEHMYEFQVGGSGPQDPNARRYVLPLAMEDDFGSKPAGDVTQTTIHDVGLAVEEPFGYWFDFGDDWWHQVTVMAIAEKAPKGKYPKITSREGASPPQYPDWDEE
ncbi:MAG: plasmid pRiA4b ORF-3 family protein [Synechococcales bacterium]|nr:plasmid pRiA4b ORF-3 family protein [Synechococcales bacterium]